MYGEKEKYNSKDNRQTIKSLNGHAICTELEFVDNAFKIYNEIFAKMTEHLDNDDKQL